MVLIVGFNIIRISYGPGCVLFYERISEWAMIGYMLAPFPSCFVFFKEAHLFHEDSVLHNEFTNGPKGWSLN